MFIISKFFPVSYRLILLNIMYLHKNFLVYKPAVYCCTTSVYLKPLVYPPDYTAGYSLFYSGFMHS